jgi:hypothetical protein
MYYLVFERVGGATVRYLSRAWQAHHWHGNPDLNYGKRQKKKKERCELAWVCFG